MPNFGRFYIGDFMEIIITQKFYDLKLAKALKAELLVIFYELNKATEEKDFFGKNVDLWFIARTQIDYEKTLIFLLKLGIISSVKGRLILEENDYLKITK